MKRLAWGFVVSAALVGVLVLGVFPTRAYLDQRRQRRAVAAEVARLAAANRSLDERVRKLHTDAEIEQLAREQYHLVRPGEEAYAILPPRQPAPATTSAPSTTDKSTTAQPTTAGPAAGTNGAGSHRHRGFWARAWHRLFTFF